MKKLYYAGIQLEKDLEFCKIFDELEKHDDVILLQHGRDCEIIEQRYIHAFNRERENTGKIHIGFDYFYINFYFQGYVWNLEPAPYYPFTDKSHPAPFCAIPYLVIDDNRLQQCGYAQPYNGVESLRCCAREGLKGTYSRANTFYKKEFLRIYEAQAGEREKSIYQTPHLLHDVKCGEGRQVVRCVAIERNADGVRPHFDIDIKSGTICG